MNEQIIRLLEEDNNFGIWIYLKKKYKGIFHEKDFDMFDKYSYFYDIPLPVMNSIIYYGMQKYDMDSTKLEENMHDICKLFQDKEIKTAREGAYLFQLYDMKQLATKLIQEFTHKIQLLENRVVKIENK